MCYLLQINYINPIPDIPRVIVYIDCTYLDIENSSCFRVDRQSMIFTSDGFIIDIHGPYFSNAVNNNARILLNVLNRDVNG